MKLAYSIPNLDELSLEDLDRYLGILSAIGYDGAETSVCYGDKVDREAVKKLLEKHNIKLSGLRSGAIYDKAGLRFTSPDPEIRRKAVDTLKKLIDLAGFSAAISCWGVYRDCWSRERTWLRQRNTLLTA